LRPAYQLATYFLTNEHALQWFTHVSLSDIHKQNHGPGILIRQQPITPAAVQITKQKIASLAGKLTFTFHSRLHSSRTTEADVLGRCYNRTYDVIEELAGTTKTPINLRNSDPALRKVRSCIFLSITFIYIALRHRDHPQDIDEAVRAFQFAFATNSFTSLRTLGCAIATKGQPSPRSQMLPYRRNWGTWVQLDRFCVPW
jgi:hypothetical protein